MKKEIYDFLAALGSIATFLALWYVWNQDRKKGKQINDLAEIASKLAGANQLQKTGLRVQNEPEFDQPQINYSSNAIHIILSLKNNSAILTNIVSDGDIIFNHKKSIPYRMYAGNNFELIGTHKEGHTIHEGKYALHIVYTDILKSKYSINISGIGQQPSRFLVTDYQAEHDY